MSEEESNPLNEKSKARSLPIIFLVPTIVFSLSSLVLLSNSSLSIHGIFQQESRSSTTADNSNTHKSEISSWCSNIANNSICCDRSDYNSDICFMRGDMRTDSSSSSILLFSPNQSSSSPEEKIRPHTRKWEAVLRDRITELHLKFVNSSDSAKNNCDVRHDVPGLFFSAGGYMGNIFHVFSNGLIPLYITSQHLNRRVAFVVLQYHSWWHTKYQEILTQLSDYPLIDLTNDTRVHCFPEAIIGLRFHRVLSVDPSRMEDNKSILDFHHMLDKAYKSEKAEGERSDKPKLVIISRSGSRAIENEEGVVQLAKGIGFDVEVLRPHDTMSMATIYRVLSSCDVMMGVHGAALTHFLFMRPGSLFIQIVPLGLEQLATLCYREAAVEMGVRYEEYRIVAEESSLFRKYGEKDLVVRDPDSVKARGWEVTKEVYLEGQNVTLNTNRLGEHLVHAFQYATGRRTLHL